MAFTKITNAGFGLTTGTLVGVAASFSSTVSVGGTLTYEDVTNVDSVGLITARSGISITGGDLTVPDAIIHTDDTNTRIRFPTADTFSVETAGNERLRINSDGLVTVGGNETVSAATGIQIENAGAALLTLLRNDATISDGNTLGGIDFYGNDGGTVQQVAKISAVADGTHGNNDKPTRLIFSTTADGGSSATERLRIDSSGTAEFTSNLAVSGSELGSRTLRIQDSTTDNAMIYGDNSGSLSIQGGASQPGSGITLLGKSASTDPGTIKFFTTTASNDIASAERMRIDSSGNVGIDFAPKSMHANVTSSLNVGSSGLFQRTKTTFVSSNFYYNSSDVGKSIASGHALIYQQDVTNGAHIWFRAGSASGADETVSLAESMRIDSSGRLLLGTTTEGEGGADNLTIADTGNCGITLRSGTSSQCNIFFSDGTSGAAEYDGYIAYNQSARHMVFGTAQSERMRIDSSGDYLFLGGTLRIKDSGNTVQRGAIYADSTTFNVNAGVNNLVFYTGGGEVARFDSSGRLLIGTTSSEAFNGTPSALQIEGASDATTRISLFRTANDNGSSVLVFAKARNTSHALLNNNDTIGKIEWYGADGNDTNQRAAIIAAEVDGSPSGNDMPGRIVFSTTADGSATPTERMRIDSSGIVKINQSSTANIFRIQNTTSGESSMLLQNSTTGYNAGNGLYIGIGSDEVSYFWAYQNENMNFGTNNTTRMTLFAGGKLRVPGVYSGTTTGGSAVYVESDGDMLRYTSSLKYKTDVETIEDAKADAILNCRPVWYRSKCANDIKTEGSEKSDWGWYGFIAEEVAEIEPRLVNWATKDAVRQEDGTVESVERDPANYEAEGVRYDNFVPLLVNLAKRQKAQIDALEARIAALEG